MARANGQLAELYMTLLKEAKGQQPPPFDDPSRGCLLALIKDMPIIWNSGAKLTKDDVLACFNNGSAIMKMMNSEYGIWALIEKWCWIVESYIRCMSLNPPGEWRYLNTLDYLRPFISPTYPYMGCLSKKRLAQLTQLYGDAEIIKVMEDTENMEFPIGIFREELAYLAGEEVPKVIKTEAELMSRTVGQVVNAKRRGRPCRGEKRSPTEQFTNLTPQSAQFQKLLESTSSASSTNSDYDSVDEYGFSVAMYSCLIEMIREKPELWQSNHSQKDNVQLQERVFAEIGKELAAKFKGNVDTTILEKLNGALVKVIWNGLKEKYREEENLDTQSKWKHFQALQFLSTRSMPALLLENVFIKNEDPAVSAALTARLAVSSPAGSSKSDDSRMAASSPATQFTAIPMTNGNKSIQTVLENLVARSLKEDPAAAMQNTDYSELKHILEQNKMIKVENDGSPPMKRVKQSVSPPGTSNSRMIVFNDTRKSAQPISTTWVPPREDLTAKGKEEPTTPAPKKAQATAVIKSGFPLEKHFKKFLQQQNAPTLVPVTAASIQTRSGLIGLNPMVIPPSALQQALSMNKIEHSSPIGNRSQLPSVSAQPTIQAQVMTNGTMNGNTEQEDKWALLGRMIIVMAREVESRDPIAASELFRDLQQTLCTHQLKSLLPKENNSQQ